MNRRSRSLWFLRCLVATCVTAALSAATFAASQGPVKVFILAGQSNMEGKAAASTLEAAIDDPSTRDEFKHLKEGGKWAVRDDVWVTYLCKKTKAPKDDFPLYGPLTVGFGSQKTGRDENDKKISVRSIGPELGFGYVVGDHFDEQVLLIKAAWGGKSIKKDFLPPSAGGPGDYYAKILEEVHRVLDDIQKYFPSYDEKRGYEITGLVWFQGWNDGVGRGNSDYTKQLSDFIRDIRRDLHAPDMRVVIGELGTDGPNAAGWIAKFRRQQAAVLDVPEFKDNVRLAKTAQFWPTEPNLDAQWQEFREKVKANEKRAAEQGKKLTSQQQRAFFRQEWLLRYKKQLSYVSDKRYHYKGSGKCYYRMGEAFGKAMLEMVK